MSNLFSRDTRFFLQGRQIREFLLLNLPSLTYQQVLTYSVRRVYVVVCTSYTHTQAYVHTYQQVLTYTHTQVHVHTYTSTRTHISTGAHVHTYTST